MYYIITETEKIQEVRKVSKGKMIYVWVPVQLYPVLEKARKVSGFNSMSSFVLYVIRRYLEEKGLLEVVSVG